MRSYHFNESTSRYYDINHRETSVTDTHSDIGEAVAAGVAIARPYGVQDGEQELPVAVQRVLPAGYEIETNDLEKYLPKPRRERGTVNLSTVDDLVSYLERFGDERTTVWVHPTSGRVESVLDDHLPALRSQTKTDDALISEVAPAVPGHGDHRAVLTLITTPEWEIWNREDSNTFNQVEFAEHIEANGKEIVKPSAAEMLEIAQNFHAVSGATFRSAKRLDNGETQLQYDETISATAGKSGQLNVPASFELAISPFVGEPLYKVNARFRYRVSGGKLTLSYLLERPDDIVRDALQSVQKRLRESFPNVYLGTPRAKNA